jgi:hypothetical protein
MLFAFAVAVAAVLTAGSASADWPTNGRTICSATGSQVHAAIATDGAGGAILSWQDRRAARVNLFAQHVLASGDVDPAWPLDGRQVMTDPLALAQEVFGLASPIITSDGVGGAIIAWEDNRSEATETDLFAQHMLASGVVDPFWPVNGAGLVVTEGVQNVPVMVPDGAGGAIVAWEDERPGASVSDIYAQHVLANGSIDPRWPATGLPVSTAAAAQRSPRIVSDALGGALITWFDFRDDATGTDIYAQHVLNSGTNDPAWPVNGRALCTAPGDQGGPTIDTDGAHGAIVAWGDSRVVATSHIFAEHVFANGTVDPAWPANGRAVSNTGLTEARPLMVSDGAGGAVIAWQSLTTHLLVFAQHVKGNGTIDPAWTPGGKALSASNADHIHSTIAPDGAGGAIVAWEENADIFAQHVLAGGTLDPTYPPDGRIVVNAPSGQSDVDLVAAGVNGAIASWTDGRNAGTSPDIFALQVLFASPVDVPGSTAATRLQMSRPDPNPARNQLQLKFALPREADVRLAIYDLQGRRVRDLANGVRSAGEHVVQWDLRDEAGRAVGAGLYLARLDAGGQSLTEKITALR